MIPKTEEELLGELDAALAHMAALTRHFHESRQGHYLLGVLTQLRALVAFDPMGRSQTLNPLLLKTAEKYNIGLNLYSRPPESKKGEPGLIGSVLAYKTWSVLPQGGFQRFTLREWLLAPAYHNDKTNEYESRNKLIRDMANKSAAHYDDHVTTSADSVRRGFGSRYSGDQFFIIDTSAAVYYLGARFFRVWNVLTDGLDPATDTRVTTLDAEFQALKISMI
jgi:hypothetical protein